MASIREAASEGSDDSDGEEYFSDDGSLTDKSVEENGEEQQETAQTGSAQGRVAVRQWFLEAGRNLKDSFPLFKRDRRRKEQREWRKYK